MRRSPGIGMNPARCVAGGAVSAIELEAITAIRAYFGAFGAKIRIHRSPSFFGKSVSSFAMNAQTFRRESLSMRLSASSISASSFSASRSLVFSIRPSLLTVSFDPIIPDAILID